MNHRMAIMIAIIFTILHVTTSHKIIERSIENENGQSARIAANSVNAFSTDFNRVMFKDKTQENLVCSSLSVAMVLMMAAYGADGKTLTEMNQVLHINNDETIQRNAIQALNSQLTAIKNVEYHLANKIYAKDSLEIKPEFKMITKTIFQSEIKKLNFSNSAAACEEINNWCEKQTNSRIKNLFQPNNFDDDTSLVLVNAVYFKGNWASKFDKNDTKLMPFYRADNTTKNVPMMHNIGKYRIADLPGLPARLIEIPYESTNISNAVSMIIMLPHYINGLQMIEENLHKINISPLLMGDELEVDLLMPKFKIESKIDLKVPLSTLGMEGIFENGANFTRITNQPPLKVSKIVQKAFIEVNEEGSEAAAVTEFELENRIGQDDVAKHTIFHVDRPFLSLIASQDVILFTAHVVDPSIA